MNGINIDNCENVRITNSSFSELDSDIKIMDSYNVSMDKNSHTNSKSAVEAFGSKEIVINDIKIKNLELDLKNKKIEQDDIAKTKKILLNNKNSTFKKIKKIIIESFPDIIAKVIIEIVYKSF